MSQWDRGSWIKRNLHPETLLDARAQRRLRGGQASIDNVRDGTTRRDFIKSAGLAGALAGLPLVAPGSRASDEEELAEDDGRTAKRGRRGTTRRTFFFNLSHLGGAATTHYLYMGGRKYRLTRVQSQPHVLALERRSNEFLRAVPDDQITHHVTGVQVTEDAVTLAYWTCNENPNSGTWEMSGMHFNVPLWAMTFAYRQARILTPRGPLPLSGKRRMYGVPPARTLQHLREESVLIDTMSFAEAVVGVHPDICSIEPTSAAHIQTNYVSQDGNTQFLQGLLQTMGPAAPAGATNVSGTTPWATLVPLMNDQTQQPYKKSGGLNQYYPDWNSQVDQNMAPAVGTIHPLVKDDPVLGIDVTGYNLNDPTSQPPPGQLNGTLWARHDGIPTVEQPTATPLALTTGPQYAFNSKNAETGLYVSTPSASVAPDNKRTQVVLNDVSNWFLRWLGVWVQFLDANGGVIPLNTLPNDTFPAEPGPYPRSIDKSDAMFLGVCPPAVAVLGIPVYPGQFSPTVYIPTGASSMRVLYTGLGLSGSILQDPVDVYDAGAIMTVAFNYGLVGLFMAAGSSTIGPTIKLAISLGGGTVASAITAIVGGVIDQSSFAKALLSFAMNFVKTFYQTGLTKVITALWVSVGESLFAAEVIDSIPVAGQVARAVAAVAGAIQLAETSIEIAISPPAYIFDFVQTHNLSITFLPDPLNRQFPQPPAGYTLYYKVSYLFDNGTATTQSAVTVDPTVPSIPITFTNIPYGGQVNISIGFYMRKNTTPVGQNDWCAGYATTGLIPNTVDVVPPPAGLTGFPITQIKIPIQASTIYIHTRKTALDGQGRHTWVTDPDGTHAPPYLPPPDGQQPGLGAFDSITVRQGTASQQGYVGYAWKAFSTGVNGCSAPAPGQFDQMANLNTDAGNGGANAQNGYVNSAGLCGYQPGLRIGYNLLTHKSLNMYLDTTALMIRPVNLDPPGFAGPGSNQSFGMLNMSSTRCLLHPAGFVVSISNANHKIEALKLPSAAQSDSVTGNFYLARTYSGMGTRPGLIMSPAAAAISPDGAVLVLEAGNNRIQAFDIGGNPVQYFKNQDEPYFLELPVTAGYTYLDLAVEFTGYLYVLSADANNNHRLDIYHPTQAGTRPICTTLNMNGAKLTVDFWRNVYTLNYEVLQLPGGILPSFTEPSVSLWVPPPPAT